LEAMLHLPLLGFSTLNIVHQHQTATQPNTYIISYNIISVYQVKCCDYCILFQLANEKWQQHKVGWGLECF
jgi:hypothetical protein